MARPADLGRAATVGAGLVAAALFGVAQLGASEKEPAVVRDYSLVRAAPAPRTQEWAEAEAKSAGCQSCHTESDAHTMHRSPAVVLGCTDCHGGNPAIARPEGTEQGGSAYVLAQNQAHVLPRFPAAWHFPSSANPQRSYSLLNAEAPEFVRFTNPGDYRVVRDSCGACHIEIIEAAERSIMSSGAMLFGGAAYNNGIVPYKNYLFGEAYTREGEPARIRSPLGPGGMTAEQRARGVLAELYPLPTWHVTPPGDVFRVFERGGRNISTQFPEIGLPNPSGSIQRLEEPGRPDLRQSNRGPATGLRVAIPILNIHKTRLNDPYMWFMGTNDQPGDYRHSGCSGCHVVYANDREPRHSLTYARHGRDGQTATVDPTIAALRQGRGHEAPADANHESVGERGHPIRHVFTRAIPTSQCMTCHMHQPNIFLNSYLGYTMWDYEADADLMWPGPENRLPARNAEEEARFRTQRYPTAAEVHAVLDRNPEGAAPRGLWADVEFLREVYDRVNPLARHTQFADYHGHGWNFRGIFRRDREGNLLDAEGAIIPPGDPDTFRRPGEGLFVPAGTNPGRSVHMMDIHAEHGLQCADCHFAQDSPRQRLHLRRGRQRDRDRLPRLPRHRARLCQSAHLRPGGAAARHQPGAAAQRGRPPPLRMDGARGRPPRPGPALDRRSGPRMGGEPGPRQHRRQPAGLRRARRPAHRRPLLQPPLGARQADVAQRRRNRPLPVRRRRARRRARPPGRRDGLLHLPPLLDDELRRLPPADRGELAHHRPPLSRRRRRATSPPTTRRSRATTCSSSAATRPARATSSRRSARPRR